MREPPCVCYCWSGRGLWHARTADRFCSLCGATLNRVAPRGPVLDRDSGPVLVAYLVPGAERGTLSGRLDFSLGVPLARPPRVRWQSRGGAEVRLVGSRLQSPGDLTVELQAPARAAAGPGVVGRSLFGLDLDGDAVAFEVELYSVAGGRRDAWLSMGKGEPPSGKELKIDRGAPRGWTYLHFRLDDNVPVAWEEVRCDHPAVTVHIPAAGGAEPVAVARIDWEPSRLRQDGQLERISFHILPRGSEEYVFTQDVSWRTYNPLRFDPPGLRIPLLLHGRDAGWTVRITNGDPQPLKVTGVTADAAWVLPSIKGLPLLLPPDGHVVMKLLLRPGELTGVEPPYVCDLKLELEGRGTQSYSVSVEDVRWPLPIDYPLVVDPGPPRVVLAYAHTDEERTVYVQGSGDRGIDSERLGLTIQEYGDAAYRGRGAADVVARLVKGARAHLRSQDSSPGRRVAVCGQPWLQAARGADVDVFDWVQLCRRHAHPVAAADGIVVRVDAWAAWFVAPPGGNGGPAVSRSNDLSKSVGALAARALLRQAAVDRGRRDFDLLAWFAGEAARPVAGAMPPTTDWLLLAVEMLLRDFLWGAAYAWDNLLQAVRDRVPEFCRVRFDAREADREFSEGLMHYARRVCSAASRLVPGGDARLCIAVSPLFVREDFFNAVRCEGKKMGLAILPAVPRWAEWAGREAVARLAPSA